MVAGAGAAGGTGPTGPAGGQGNSVKGTSYIDNNLGNGTLNGPTSPT